MRILNWTRKISRGLYLVNEFGSWIGYVALAGIVLIVFADVFGRYFLNRPLLGSNELVNEGMCILAGFAIMYTTLKRGHVSLDLILNRFPKSAQMIMQRIFSLIGFGVAGSLAYGVYLLAMRYMKRGATTEILGISTIPFTLLFAAALFLSSLTLLLQTFQTRASDETSEGVRVNDT